MALLLPGLPLRIRIQGAPLPAALLRPVKGGGITGLVVYVPVHVLALGNDGFAIRWPPSHDL